MDHALTWFDFLNAVFVLFLFLIKNLGLFNVLTIFTKVKR
jgi:hypothetical protein